jgi:hypothetical protein
VALVSDDGVPAPLLLHAHLFKNAGSSFDWALARCFGEAFLDHRDDEAMRGRPAYLRALIEARDDLRALSSHWLPLPPPATRRQVYPVALLREPLARLRSVYDFERRQAVDHPGTRKARVAGFRDYVAWRLTPGTGPVLRNYQTRMLSGRYPGNDDEAQAAAALATIELFPVLGLVERFDETMVLLEERLSDTFPDLDLAYVGQNISEREPGAGRNSVEEDLGDLLDDVRAVNARDIALYEHAVRRFEKQWRALPDADRRLAAFRDRCEALRAAAS